jgi:hypothetical protein
MLSSRRHHYLAAVSILLITAALIVGMVGCDGVEYDLTITSTAGGSVTTPGEGTFTYDEGTVVNLTAEADEGYYFINWTSDADTIDDVDDPTTTVTMDDSYSVTANFGFNITLNITPMVDAGRYHTVGLKSDGTVVATGSSHYGQCNVGGWTSIVRVAAGTRHTVGLKSDGTVVAVGDYCRGERNVSNWTDIVQVAAGYFYTVGVKSDGTVVAAGPMIELATWDLF